jgi:hypothetical protein
MLRSFAHRTAGGPGHEPPPGGHESDDGEQRPLTRIKQPWLRAAVWTVDLFDPPRYFSWRSRTGTVETTGGHLLEERDGATRATVTIRHSGSGAALAGLLLGPLVRRYVMWELRGLKARSEQMKG